ncbi:MAG: DNA-deoxyinosine glycosylase [Micavibrio sp.]|nr:DNA-deoxyinosine glycosylase [Micavibrio sp.]
MHHEARSFSPIIAKEARTLILGSMPGIKSLQEQQYYAHPQNAFWKIMTALFDMPVETYAQRQAIITGNNLALWDVLKYCERSGSLDTRIDDKTIEVNDFAGLFKKQPHIRHIYFNGAKSEKEFLKRVIPTLPDDVKTRLMLTRLPSTSPAHAGKPLRDKVRDWKIILKD